MGLGEWQKSKVNIKPYHPGHSPTLLGTAIFTTLALPTTTPMHWPPSILHTFQHFCMLVMTSLTLWHAHRLTQQAYACTCCSWHLPILYYLPTTVLPALPAQTKCTCLPQGIPCIPTSINRYRITLPSSPTTSSPILSTKAYRTLTPSYQTRA